MDESDRTLLHRRRWAAPPEKVFRAFQDPERLARWWGPEGFRNTFQRFEFRPGGRWTFVMHGPDGNDYPNDSRFEVVEPRRIVVRHESAPGFRLAVTFDPAGTGSEIEWRQVFDTAELRQGLEAICRPANEQNLDRLAAEVAAMA